jgi:hypothetical protein
MQRPPVTIDRAPIFLLSLPHAGSTLVQRVLGAHEAIATVSEPWLLLAPLYAIREGGAYAEYRHFLSRLGIADFCRELPNGRDDYLGAVRIMALRLYALAGNKPGARYFLDKTPSYSLIVDDIARAFPEAKLLFLWRNPLAIVASEVETLRRQRWRLHHVKVQLYEGLVNLVAARQRLADRSCAVHYERLVTEPGSEWPRVFAYLGLRYDPGVLERFRDVELKGRVQDPTAARWYPGLSTEPLGKWRATLASPVRKLWCRRYLRWIGAERLALMGYDLDALLRELGALPADLRRVGPDLLDSVLSVAWEIIEPRILWDKFQTLRAGQRLYTHE